MTYKARKTKRNRARKTPDSPRGSDIPLGYKHGVASRLLTPKANKIFSMLRDIFPKPIGVKMGREKAEKENDALVKKMRRFYKKHGATSL